METYFKFKLYTYLVGIILICAVLFLTIAYTLYNTLKVNRISKYMKTHGYEYELISVSSCGGSDYYEFRKGDTRVSARRVFNMSFREVKKNFK